MVRRGALVLVLGGALLACRGNETPTSAAPVRDDELHLPASVLVTRERADLLFTWIDPTGAFHDTTSIDAIPETSRAQVLVRDLSKSPAELRTDTLLYVADLRTADAQGRFSCGVVSRRAFDRRAVRSVAAETASAAVATGERLVTVYSTDWCGVCRRTKAFLRGLNVGFVERDVEKDDGAAEELERKAANAGLVPQGVPVIDIAGELMLGFDADRLRGLLAARGFLPAQ